MDYREELDGSLLIRLYPGEEIIQSLTGLSKTSGIVGATFFGIGALDFAELGYYYPDRKQYDKRKFEGQHELLSLSGNIGFAPDGEIAVHAHVVISDNNFICHGGHLFQGRVSVVAEIRLFPCGDIKRVPDPSGLNLWKLND